MATVATRWLVVVEGKQHLVELKLGYMDAPPFIGESGRVADRLLVDEEVVLEWNSSAWWGPKRIPFTISEEPAILVRKGVWDWRRFCFDTHSYELFFKGEKIEVFERQSSRSNIFQR